MKKNNKGMYRHEIRKFRFLNNEMDQKELGGMIGVSKQTICEIETGKRTPSLHVAYRLAKLMNTSIEALFFPEGK